MDDKTRKLYEEWGVEPPSSDVHGDVRSNLRQLMPHTWVLKGNQLTGYTEDGTLVQTIPTDYILTGKDDKGLPIFKRVVL